MNCWLCVSLSNGVEAKTAYSDIRAESVRIFGTNSELFIPGDFATDSVYDCACDGYIFTKTVIKKSVYMSKLKKSDIFYSDGSHPPIITDREIQLMQHAFELRYRRKFEIGDIVKIEYGPFSNLFGMVCELLSEDRYEVCVRLFSRQYIIISNSQNLAFTHSSTIKPMRKPVRA